MTGITNNVKYFWTITVAVTCASLLLRFRPRTFPNTQTATKGDVSAHVPGEISSSSILSIVDSSDPSNKLGSTSDMTHLKLTPLETDEVNLRWVISDIDPSLFEGSDRCTIERILEEDLSPERFANEFWRIKPVILLRKDSTNSKAQRLTEKQILLDNFGANLIPLAKLESYAYRDEQKGTLKDYIDTISKENEPSAKTRFAFSTDQYGVGKDYIIPSVVSGIPDLLSPDFQVAIAGSGTGLAFHWHADVFAETLHGIRRWFLFPPYTSPKFNPRSSSAEWVRNIRPSLLTRNDQDGYDVNTTFQECTLKPNEAIYVPADWYHSTLSLTEAVSITTSYATTYRRDRYHLEFGASDNAQMLDAFSQGDFFKAIQFAEKLIHHRPNNFAPYSWLGVILTMDAQERHTQSLVAFRNVLQSANDATRKCIALNPYFCPCYVWSSRQLMALSLTYKSDNPAMAEALMKQAHVHVEAAEQLSSVDDDELLDPRWQPKSMNSSRRHQLQHS